MNTKTGDKTMKKAFRLVAKLALLASVSQVQAADIVEQVLDSVVTNSATEVAEMLFNDPTMRNSDSKNEYMQLDVSGADLRTCKLTAIDGLFCLDGKNVVRSLNPTEAGAAFDPVINCESIPVLDAKKDDTCTTLTVSLDGTLWLGGKAKGKAYNLIEVIKVPELTAPDCPDGDGYAAVGSGYCWRVVTSGRPLLVAISSIDGDVAESFSLFGDPYPGGGLLLLEERTTATFIDFATETPVEVADKFAWDLRGPNRLQDLTLLQIVGATSVQNVILATDDNGRVLAIDTDVGGPATAVFDIPTNREGTTTCNDAEPQYSIEASSKTGLVFVTDSQYCEVMALQVNSTTGIIMAADGLEVATEGDAENSLILSTRDTDPLSDAFIAPNNVTVTPGISINLNECTDATGPCPLVVGENGEIIAQLSSVNLASENSGMTLFQITGIPDCRFIPDVCVSEFDVSPSGNDVEDLIAAGYIVPRVADDHVDYLNPAAQRLNVTKLLPTEITQLFEPGELPDMLLEAYYRGQRDSGFRLQAFFARTQEGVIFEQTFDAEYKVARLTSGDELGCPLSTDMPPPETLGDLLAWDVVTTVSERYPSPSGAGVGPDPQHVATIENVGCGSSRTISDRWSLKPYNLEVTPCTFNPDSSDNWWGHGGCIVGGADTVDDAVFAKLLLALFDELGGTLNQFVCPAGGPLLASPGECGTLEVEYLNALDKLDKCWSATQQPKQSSGNQNCQAFISQLTGLQATANGLSPNPADTANRIGEVVARIARIFHIHDERFVPSIPEGGFSEPPAPAP